MEVRAELHASDYGVKKKELEDLETTIQLLAGNSRQWREIRAGLSQWAEDEDISGYISNPTLQCLEDVLGGEVTSSNMEKFEKKAFQAAMELIEEELADLNERIRETAKELKEKQEMVEDLKK